ncbi:type VII secretion-associated serine protease mycosin [Streptomyces sp. KLOTTS4A1]|uniref:type VII secretion-associated serine protease mycosin n=1 Tax=Streptomyces sp. KLOTTS4A1 TaxID=3390996 RepID=UPI0039F51930
MPVTSRRTAARGRGWRPAVSGTLGLLMLGVATAPAQADTIRSQQWHLTAMKAEEMWKTSTGEGVTVAVIDTGVDNTNPDLRGQVLDGRDYAPDEPGDEHTDLDGHGTAMAGLIAGTGESGGGDGAFGLAPGVKILPLRIADDDTNMASSTAKFNKYAPRAIRYATDTGAKVINISQAVPKGSTALKKAVAYALNNGALVFAGVGNDGDVGNATMYPAATPGVVGVSAVGKDLHKTDESQYGPQVDLAAPGDEMVYACGGETGLCTGHGTSASTALASASAALIWSKYPDWTNNQVLRVMLNTAGAPTSGAKRNDHIGYGIVRPRIALKTPGDPGPADEYPLPDLAAAAESPAPDEQQPQSDGKQPESSTAAADTTEDGTTDDDTSWPLLTGLGAAVLLAGAVTAVAVTRRRRTT